jgi:hypothetical protein
MKHFSTATLLCSFVVACGSSTPVTELSEQAQVELCEAFLDDICAHPDFADFCANPCHVAGCMAAATEGAIDTECGLAEDGGTITDDDVASCGATGGLVECLSGGGCMFDALEERCP